MNLAGEYGKALFMLTEERETTDTALADVLAADAIFKENPDYVKLLDTPALGKAEKLALCEEAFHTLDEDVKSLIKILCERHSVHSFSDVRRSFMALYNESRGIVNVEAVTAVAMTDAQIERLREKLALETGKTIIINNTVEPGILGGMKLRYLGRQLDGSVKTRLDQFEKSLKNTVI
jgi:F-type H+-transporting ATPase subunit delta